MDLRADSRGGKRSSSMRRSTFSTTTMASSTNRPIASTIPNMVSVFIENPAKPMTVNVPSRTTGMVMVGISVARMFCRNRYMSRNTRMMASIRVLTTSVSEMRTKGVVS